VWAAWPQSVAHQQHVQWEMLDILGLYPEETQGKYVINKNKMLYPILLAILLFNSLSTIKENKGKSKFYKDVNIYSLKGIEEVRPANYPNVEIVDSANHRILIYHINDNKSFDRDYHREQNLWICNIFEKDDTGNIYTKRVIYPDKLVEYSYTDTLRNKVFDVGILIKDTMKYFKPIKAYNRKLTLSDAMEIKEKVPYTFKYWYKKAGKIVRFITESNDPYDKGPMVNCYLNKNRSFFWWYETQPYLDTIPCK
jgi:hypothetical protein